MLLAVSLIAALSVGAALLLQQAGSLGQLSGASLRGRKTLSVAEDGARWGLDVVNAAAYPNNGNVLDLTGLQALPALGANDVLCPDAGACSRFRLLSGAQAVGNDGGSAKVAVTCNPNGCSGAPANLVNFQIRSLGSLPSGENRLVEMVVAPLSR